MIDSVLAELEPLSQIHVLSLYHAVISQYNFIGRSGHYRKKLRLSGVLQVRPRSQMTGAFIGRVEMPEMNLFRETALWDTGRSHISENQRLRRSPTLQELVFSVLWEGCLPLIYENQFLFLKLHRLWCVLMTTLETNTASHKPGNTENTKEDKHMCLFKTLYLDRF